MGTARIPVYAGLVLPYGGIGIAHQAGATAYRHNLAGLHAQVIIFKEEEIVAKFMNQGARPILAKIAAGGAEAVPDRAHPHLARAVHHRAKGGRVGERLSRNAANQSGGPHAVGGVDTDVGGVPVFFVLKNSDAAKGSLALGSLEEQLRGAGEVGLKLGHKARIVAGVPLQGEAQVEERQRVRQRHRDRLDAGACDRESAHAVCGSENVGGEETHGLRVGVGVVTRQRNRSQGNKLVARSQLAAPAEVAAGIGDEGRGRG